jgi:hypothetical protein
MKMSEIPKLGSETLYVKEGKYSLAKFGKFEYICILCGNW